jgi:arylsulfatase B
MREDGCVECGANCSQPRFDLQGEYSTFIFTKRAEEVIKSHNETQRLFLYLAYQAVHCPSEVPIQYTVPYAHLPEPRKTFAGMLSCLDEGVGNVTSMLKSQGLWEDTLLIVTTDNGAPTPSCGGDQGGQNYWPFSPQGPLRGGKCSAWEGGLRGTAFVSSPLFSAAIRGRHVMDLMHAVDWLPTIITATHGNDGLDRVQEAMRMRGKPLDGVSLWATIASEEAIPGPRTEVLLEADPYALPLDPQYCGDQHGSGAGTGYYALRRGNLKVILGDPAGGSGDGWYCTGAPCNYTGWVPSPTVLNATSLQLFDVVADPGEHHDLSGEQPETTQMLLAALLAYNSSAEPSYACGPQGPWQVNGTLSPFG